MVSLGFQPAHAHTHCETNTHAYLCSAKLGTKYYEIEAQRLDYYIQKFISRGYRIAIYNCDETLKESK